MSKLKPAGFFDPPPPKREAVPPRTDVYRCEACGERASYGYGPPGIAGMKEPRRWRCGRHRIENEGRAG